MGKRLLSEVLEDIEKRKMDMARILVNGERAELIPLDEIKVYRVRREEVRKE